MTYKILVIDDRYEERDEENEPYWNLRTGHRDVDFSFDVEGVNTYDEFAERLRINQYDAVIVDLVLVKDANNDDLIRKYLIGALRVVPANMPLGVISSYWANKAPLDLLGALGNGHQWKLAFSYDELRNISSYPAVLYNLGNMIKLSKEPHVSEQKYGCVEGHRTCLVGFVDFVKSTETIMKDIYSKPDERADFMRDLVNQLYIKISKYGGQVLSFTGDGVVFFFEEKSVTEARDKTEELDPLYDALGHLNTDISRWVKTKTKSTTDNIPVPKFRIALDYGDVFVGMVGPTKNIIGLPVVIAARLCAQRDIYEEKGPLLVTRKVFEGINNWPGVNNSDLKGSFAVNLPNFEQQSIDVWHWSKS